PHFVQQGLIGALGLPPHKIRVIAPDLGGGFGTKASGYAEDALVPIAAKVLGRPVKWIEDRREHMSAAAHARHQTHAISLAASRGGCGPRASTAASASRATWRAPPSAPSRAPP